MPHSPMGAAHSPYSPDFEAGKVSPNVVGLGPVNGYTPVGSHGGQEMSGGGGHVSPRSWNEGFGTSPHSGGGGGGYYPAAQHSPTHLGYGGTGYGIGEMATGRESQISSPGMASPGYVQCGRAELA
jgi:hypothetical protein